MSEYCDKHEKLGRLYAKRDCPYCQIAELTKHLEECKEACWIASSALQDITAGELVNAHCKNIAKRALNMMCRVSKGGAE